MCDSSAKDQGQSSARLRSDGAVHAMHAKAAVPNILGAVRGRKCMGPINYKRSGFRGGQTSQESSSLVLCVRRIIQHQGRCRRFWQTTCLALLPGKSIVFSLRSKLCYKLIVPLK